MYRMNQRDIQSTYRMSTVDITNLYTNIPNKEAVN
jgi:hypothetical protein